MKCDLCEGFGMLTDSAERKPWTAGDDPASAPAAPVPCPRCGGAGISHCCEGDRCQPGDAE